MTAQLKYLLVLTLTIPLLANAQKAPGYLGKRYSVGYDAYIFPSFFNPNSPDAEPKSSYALRPKGVSLNVQHNIGGQWSFSKKASLIGNIGYVSTNFVPGYNTIDNFHFEEYPSMSATSFNLGVRLFTQHYAPLGKYIEFRVGVAQVKADDFTYSIEDLSGSGDTLQYTVDGGSMLRPNVALAFGTSRVIKDVIIISYGLDFNFYSGGFGHYSSLLGQAPRSDFRSFEEGNSSTNQESLVKMAGARYAIQCAINLRIGIGILL